MSTFAGSFLEGCSSCGEPMPRHDAFTMACPRPVSQPLSRVVAGPAQHEDGCPGCFVCVRPTDEEGCGGPREACGKPGCPECGRPSSLIADVAAFRALTPEQRAALLQIGADGPALLEALALFRSYVDMQGIPLGVLGAWSPAASALGRIDARRS